MTAAGNCAGAHEPDKARPLDQCQSCQHWRSTTGERVFPMIQVRHNGAQVIVMCGRRLPVKAEG